MTVEEHVRYWLESADEDFASAEGLLKGGHYAWSLFVGHLVLEKDLKAAYVRKVQETPPKIHNLATLATKAELTLTDDQKEFLAVANMFNIAARYSNEKRRFYRIAGRDYAERNLAGIKEFHLWLRSQMKA